MKKINLIFTGTILSISIFATGSFAYAEEAEHTSIFAIGDMTVTNTTDLMIEEGSVETKKEGEEEISTVILKEEDGKEHLFEKVDVKDWKDLTFVEEYEMYYLCYTDQEGKSREAEEKTDEILWTQPITMYAMGSVNVRTEPENGAEAIYYASLGEEFQVLGLAPGWFKLQINETQTGYVYHKYLTEDRAVVDTLIAQEEARLAAEAAYAEYLESYTYTAPSSGKSSSGKKQQKTCLDDGILN